MSKLSRVFLPLFVITVSVLVLIVAVVLFFVSPRSPETTSVVAEKESVVAESTHQTLPVAEPDLSKEMKEPTSGWYGSVSIADLIEECPEPFGFYASSKFVPLSAKCVSMLEPFFIDLPYIPENGFQWLKFPQRITYRRIFENPQWDRELVLAALQRPECLFEDGDKGIRADLRESCHAESFYVMASFAEICFARRDSRNLEDYDNFYGPRKHFWKSKVRDFNTSEQWEEHLTELATGADGQFNQTQYTRVKEEVWHTALVDHWYRHKCQEYDRDSMEIDWENDDSEYLVILESLLERLTDEPPAGRSRYSNHDVYVALNVIAAHLGDFSASLLYVSPYQHHLSYNVSSSLIHQVRKQHSWMSPFDDASTLQSWGRIQYRPDNVDNIEYEYKFFVDRSIEGLLKLDELGIEYDAAALVDQLCRRTPELTLNYWPRKPSCKNAIDRLSIGENVSFERGLKYEEFRSIAIELGVWN